MYLITYAGRTVIHDGSVERPRRLPMPRETRGADRSGPLDATLEDCSRNEYNRSRNENSTKPGRVTSP